MGGNYRELRVWQQGMELVLRIYAITRKFPKDELYGMVSQMRRAAVSVVSNIAEGKGRNSRKELGHFASNARGSLHELETQVLVASRLKYILADEEQELLARTTDIGKMLTGLMGFASESHS